jgi:hypothetical protein
MFGLNSFLYYYFIILNGGWVTYREGQWTPEFGGELVKKSANQIEGSIIGRGIGYPADRDNLNFAKNG